jgi:hypothetical protein
LFATAGNGCTPLTPFELIKAKPQPATLKKKNLERRKVKVKVTWLLVGPVHRGAIHLIHGKRMASRSYETYHLFRFWPWHRPKSSQFVLICWIMRYVPPNKTFCKIKNFFLQIFRLEILTYERGPPPYRLGLITSVLTVGAWSTMYCGCMSVCSGSVAIIRTQRIRSHSCKLQAIAREY